MIEKKIYDPTLDIFRIAASIGVVLIHISGFYLFTTPIGSGHRLLADLANSFSRWCVPMFFMMSGILLLNPKKVDEPLSEFFAKRLHKVIIPYLAWNVIYYLIGEPGVPLDLSISDFFLQILGNGVYPYHLWFLAALIGVYIMVPFLRIIVAHGKQEHLHGLALLFIIFSSINSYLEFSSGLSLHALGFTPSIAIGLGGYTILGYLVRTDDRVSTYFSLRLVMGAFVVLGLAIFGITRYTSNQHGVTSEAMYQSGQLLVILLSLSALLIGKYLKPAIITLCTEQRTSQIRYLASLTLGVYILHPLVLRLMTHTKVIYGIFGHQGYLHYGMSFFVMVIGSFALTAMIHRIPYIRQLLPA